jgi:hypothetical protein
MITVVCGENSPESRTCFNDLIKSFREKGIEIRQIKNSELTEITKWSTESASLFSQEKVFITENLNKLLSKRKNPSFLTFVESLCTKKEISIISWEDSIPARNLKFPKGSIIKEFKLSSSIFKLLDSCYPGNLKSFIDQLNQEVELSDEIFIFIMLIRHIRNILLISLGEIPAKLQSWQVAKLKQQAHFWQSDKLLDFYEGFYNIDKGLKTGTNPFSVLKSMEVLVCYYL